MALVMHLLYSYMVTDFGDYETLNKIIWSLEVQTVIAVRCKSVCLNDTDAHSSALTRI
jgi:hypothetical protein